MPDWMPIAIALLVSLLGLAVEWGMYRRRWKEVDEVKRKFDGYHKQHFQAAQMALAEQARVGQAVTDLEKHNTERIVRIEAMFDTINKRLMDLAIAVNAR